MGFGFEAVPVSLLLSLPQTMRNTFLTHTNMVTDLHLAPMHTQKFASSCASPTCEGEVRTGLAFGIEVLRVELTFGSQSLRKGARHLAEGRRGARRVGGTAAKLQ